MQDIIKQNMRNGEIAQLLGTIASLLELKGENRFKQIAYADAARQIENWPVPVEDMWKDGRLQKIPGVGAGIAKKIAEVLETGRCGFLEELKAEIPVELLELERVPGVGPKLALMLYQELGICSISALEEAVRAGRLRSLPRLGPKSEQNILRGIETLVKQSGRIPLGVAMPVAEGIVARLRQSCALREIQVCGSLRRWKETIGDLDLLVEAVDAEPVMKAFTAMPEAAQILGTGPTKSTILTSSGLQVDLRVVPPDSWGAALQYFTGSQAHNVHLRELAIRQGMKLNEYGLFRMEDNRKRAGETEEGIYQALGLEWVPPELREDQGEVEAAQKKSLPRLVELKDIRGDLHTHTAWSDGSDSLAEIVRAAERIGYQYLVISDHGQALGVANGLTWERFLQQRAELQSLEFGSGFQILWGVEANILNEGRLDFPLDSFATFDLVLAGIHSGLSQTQVQITQRVTGALSSGRVDILVHPTGRLIGKRNPFEIEIGEVMATAAVVGAALEINASPERLDLKDIDARAARDKFGLKLALGTDAHSTKSLETMRYGVALARRAWLEPRDLLNTLPAKELRDWIARRRTQNNPLISR
jgi:DNA polymerase (family 10)